MGYRAVDGINYTPAGSTSEVRIEPGARLPDDFPGPLAKQWAAEGILEETDDLTCTVCGYEARSPGGLSSHSRVHEEN